MRSEEVLASWGDLISLCGEWMDYLEGHDGLLSSTEQYADLTKNEKRAVFDALEAVRKAVHPIRDKILIGGRPSDVPQEPPE